MKQIELFAEVDDIERQVQAILTRRRAHNTSGQMGEDIDLIRATIARGAPVAA